MTPVHTRRPQSQSSKGQRQNLVSLTWVEIGRWVTRSKPNQYIVIVKGITDCVCSIQGVHEKRFFYPLTQPGKRSFFRGHPVYQTVRGRSGLWPLRLYCQLFKVKVDLKWAGQFSLNDQPWPCPVPRGNLFITPRGQIKIVGFPYNAMDEPSLVILSFALSWPKAIKETVNVSIYRNMWTIISNVNDLDN